MARVLVACEFSGRVRAALRRLGVDAISCDLLPAEDGSEFHYQGDVLDILDDGWDGLIGFPTCTYLTNAGAKHLYIGKKGTQIDPVRWKAMEQGAAFFNRLKLANIPRIALENPIPHKHSAALIGNYDQILGPHWFGHHEQKQTCLWLKNLPLLTPTKFIDLKVSRLCGIKTDLVHYAAPGPERWKNRSRTYQGFADAMAAQWGPLF